MRATLCRHHKRRGREGGREGGRKGVLEETSGREGGGDQEEGYEAILLEH